MYKLKQLPEDFVVKEISDLKFNESGSCTYFKLKKKGRNTLDAIKEIAKALGIKEKQIGFAGSKDKHAVTEQIISIKGTGKEKVLRVKVDHVELEFLGFGDQPVSLGDLIRNGFEITVRNLDEVSLEKIDYVENYFDEQRFSYNNVEIGRNIVKKDFGNAAKLVDYRGCQEHLAKKKSDFIGALKKVPLRLLRMYVNAYQSYLWNETIARYLKSKVELASEIVAEVSYSQGKLVFVRNKESLIDLDIPLIGFSPLVIEDAKLKDLITEIMNEENLGPNDFVIKQIPELSLEGDSRKAVVAVQNLVIRSIEEDELNHSKKKILLKFSLSKGSYATMVVKRLFSS